jgi:hypothetical protein
MAHEAETPEYKPRERKGGGGNPTSSAVYGLGFLGALAYFIIHATSFWSIVLGILMSVLWPAVLVFKLLEFVNM